MSQIQLHCRRGMLELDFIFERFLNHHYDQLSITEQQLFSQLLQEEDPVLFDWLISDIPCTHKALQPMIVRIKNSYFK